VIGGFGGTDDFGMSINENADMNESEISNILFIIL
jgi:hypothetical protein